MFSGTALNFCNSAIVHLISSPALTLKETCPSIYHHAAQLQIKKGTPETIETLKDLVHFK